MRNGWITWKFGNRVATLLGFGTRPDAVTTRGMTLGHAAETLGRPLGAHARAIVAEFAAKKYEQLARGIESCDFPDVVAGAMAAMHADMSVDIATRGGRIPFVRGARPWLRISLFYRGVFVLCTDIALSQWSYRYTRDFEAMAWDMLHNIFVTGQRRVCENLDDYNERAVVDRLQV